MGKTNHGGPTLQFLGATDTVTGSKFLLKTGESNWLVDCGLFQGLKEHRLRNWAPLPFAAKDISGVLLTHAHIDHSGYIPLLIKNGFHGRVFASEPTVELCKILLPDSGYLQEEDAKYATKKGFSKHSTAMPLYTYSDAIHSLGYFQSIPNGDVVRLEDDMSVQLVKAGHILGARFLQVTVQNGSRHRILFAGDIGRYDSLVANAPTPVHETDYLVLESTYGDRTHPEEDVFARLAGIVNDAVKVGGKVLIPAFAVGRTQDILYILKKLCETHRIPSDIPIYLNTPLGIDATSIYLRFSSEHRIRNGGKSLFQAPNIYYVHDMEASKRLNAHEGPAIIIAGSGMLTGGRILHHLKAYAGDPTTRLIIVGYQADGTRGRAMLDGAKSIKIHGQPYSVRCKVEHIDSLSAHGDSDDIMTWLKQFDRPPRQTFLVHGEPRCSQALAERIRDELHWPVYIPKYLETVSL
jgi:metallo-beta-lactamase family protein